MGPTHVTTAFGDVDIVTVLSVFLVVMDVRRARRTTVCNITKRTCQPAICVRLFRVMTVFNGVIIVVVLSVFPALMAKPAMSAAKEFLQKKHMLRSGNMSLHLEGNLERNS